MPRGGSSIFYKGGGGILGLQAVKGRGGGVQEGGPTLIPMLKSLQRGPKRRGPDPRTPPPPRSAHACRCSLLAWFTSGADPDRLLHWFTKTGQAFSGLHAQISGGTSFLLTGPPRLAGCEPVTHVRPGRIQDFGKGGGHQEASPLNFFFFKADLKIYI